MSSRTKKNSYLRPTPVDHLRAFGYAVLLVWSVLFINFPPLAFLNGLNIYTLVAWQSITIVGAAMAIVGSWTRIDIKLEFPGILVALIGPGFYFLSQIYVVLTTYPSLESYSRTALIAYALLPAVLLLPRAFELFSESRRLKRINLATRSGNARRAGQVSINAFNKSREV